MRKQWVGFDFDGTHTLCRHPSEGLKSRTENCDTQKNGYTQQQVPGDAKMTTRQCRRFHSDHDVPPDGVNSNDVRIAQRFRSTTSRRYQPPDHMHAARTSSAVAHACSANFSAVAKETPGGSWRTVLAAGQKSRANVLLLALRKATTGREKLRFQRQRDFQLV